MAPSTRGATFRSLQVRNFRLFFVGQLVSQVGNWLTSIALILLVLHMTHSGLAIGLLTACQFGPVLVLGAWAGLVADRSNKRTLLLTTQSLQMCQSFALAVLAFMPNPPIAGLYLAALAGGLFLAFDNPTRRAFVPEMVPPELVQNSVSLNSALMTSARIFGPALAGLLAVTVGFGWCFAIDGISYVAVLAALWMMRTSELRQPPRTPRARGQVRAGLRYVREVPDLWIPLAMMALVGTLTFNFSVVIPLFVERSLHGTDTTYTLLYSVLSIGSLAGALVSARLPTIEVRTIVAASTLFGVAMLLFSTSPDVAIAFLFALLVGFASVAFMTGCTAIMQVRSADEMRGRVVALQAIVLMGSTPIGGPVLGAICDRMGARSGVVIGGLAALVAALCGLLALRRLGPPRGSEAPIPATEHLAEVPSAAGHLRLQNG